MMVVAAICVTITSFELYLSGRKGKTCKEISTGSIWCMTTASFAEMFVMLRLLFVDGYVDDEVDIFEDLDNAAGVASDSNSCPESCQQTEIIRPGPVKLRRQGRRLFNQNQAESKEPEEFDHNKEACTYLMYHWFFCCFV
jgi:hypothetical protein